jgi:phospholipid/cholesterol/gamma-HCH transport system substrate-binding protein
MKFSKEARIGLMVAVSVLVLFAGFYFLKGSNVFSSENDYYAYYDNVSGLQPSAAVQLKGMSIGKVSAIQLNGKEKVKVTISINKKIRLPAGTLANLTSLDMLGTKGISLDLGNGSEMLEDGSMLPSAIEGGLMDKLSVEVTPLLQDVRLVVNHVDSVLLAVNQIFSQRTRDDLQKSIAALHTSMDHFSNVSGALDRQSGTIEKVIGNANRITTNLANNNENIDQTLKNLRTTTSNLSQARIQETIAKLDKMADELGQVSRKLNEGQGTLGMAINDKQMYNEINTTLKSLSDLAADLKQHPTRYINLTVFGRKAKVGTD